MSTKTLKNYIMIASMAFVTGVYFSNGIKNRFNHFVYRDVKIEKGFENPFNLKIAYRLNKAKKFETYMINVKTKMQQPVFSGMKVGKLNYRLKGIEEEINNTKLLDIYGDSILHTAEIMKKKVYKKRYGGKRIAHNFYNHPLDLEVVVKMNQDRRVESYLSNGLEEQPIRYNFQLGSSGYRIKGALQDGRKKVSDIFESTKEKLNEIFDP